MAADGLGGSLAALALAHPVVWLYALGAALLLLGIGVAAGAWGAYGHARAELDTDRTSQPLAREEADQ